MVNIDNLTVVYLIGFVSLSYGVVQALTLRDEYHSSRIWALAQILFGLGFIGLAYFGKNPLPKYWIGSYGILVLAALTQLTAIARFGKNPIPKAPAAICLVALLAIIFLFESTRRLGAPLASLEAFLFAPLAAIYIYMAWFSGKMGGISNSLYLKMASGAFWIYAVLMVLTLLLSLFGLGQGLIDTSSTEIRILALASLVLSLVTNYLWSIQAAELSQTDINLVNFDIALEAKANAVPVFITAPSKKGQSKQPKKDTLYSGSTFDKTEKADKVDKSEKASKAQAVKQAVVNPDQLSIPEQEALLALLTSREREVFLLAAEGMKNGQIAEALSSTESSIKVHRSRMLSKLAISNVEGLVKLKQNLGLGATSVTAESQVGQELTLESTAALIQSTSDSTLSEKKNPPEEA